MKRLKEEQCDLLMQIVSQHYPNQQILHITDGGCDLHEALCEMTKAREFEYDLRYLCPTPPALGCGDHPAMTVEPLDLKERRFNKHARLYENIFVSLEDPRLEADIEETLKKFYRIMKNAGVLVLLLQKEGSLRREIDRYLEESFFVAINHIDIFDDYDVVNAKKLHGWGAYEVGF
ncbi:hypothetical protein [Hydrogenimonas sp.]